jgi:hypothetical protein
LTKDSSRWVRWLFGQWLAGGNFTAQSGVPFTANISSDQANIGSGPSQRPNVSGDPNDGPKTPEQWFNTSIFSLLHCIHSEMHLGMLLFARDCARSTSHPRKTFS